MFVSMHLYAGHAYSIEEHWQSLAFLQQRGQQVPPTLGVMQRLASYHQIKYELWLQVRAFAVNE